MVFEPQVWAFVAAALLLFLRFLNVRGLAALIVAAGMASPFTGATVVNIYFSSGYVFGITLGYLFTTFAVMAWTVKVFGGLSSRRKCGFGELVLAWMPGIILVVYAMWVSLFSPLLFGGRVEILNPRRGMTFGAVTSLTYFSTHISQTIYLISNVILAILVSDLVRHHCEKVIRLVKGAWLAVAVIVVIFLTYEALARVFSWAVPYEWFYTNPARPETFMQVAYGWKRLSLPFMEPSEAGMFLMAVLGSLVWSVARNIKGSIVRGMLLFGVIVLSVMTSSTLAMIGSGLVLIVAVIRTFIKSVSANKADGRIGVLVVAFLVALIALYMGLVGAGVLAGSGKIRDTGEALWQAVAKSTIEKYATESFKERSFSIMVAWNAFIGTFGLGVGLGGNRSTSIIMTLLSTVGVVGMISSAWLVLRAWQGMSRAYHSCGGLAEGVGLLQGALFGFIIAMVFAKPDITYPIFWILIGSGVGLWILNVKRLAKSC